MSDFKKTVRSDSVPMVRFEICAVTGSVLGIAAHNELGFYRALVAMSLCGLILAMVFGVIYSIIMRKLKWHSKISNYIFMLFIACISFVLAFISIYRTPQTAFESEFGFSKPESVVIESMDIIYIEKWYYSLMKFTANADIVMKIMNKLKLKEINVFDEEDSKEYKEYEVKKFIGRLCEKLPKSWSLSQLNNLRFFCKEQAGEPKLLLYDAVQKTVYYQRKSI